SIVFDQPGTTRDVVTATTAFAGWWVELRDTAGIRETSDPLEAEGSARARRQIDEADLVVWVRDASRPHAVNELSAAAVIKSVVLWNKCDLATPPDDAALQVSAETGRGLEELQRRIVRQLCLNVPPTGQA